MPTSKGSGVCEGELLWSPKLPAFQYKTEEYDYSIEGKEGQPRNWKPVSFSSCRAEDLLSFPFYPKSSGISPSSSSYHLSLWMALLSGLSAFLSLGPAFLWHSSFLSETRFFPSFCNLLPFRSLFCPTSFPQSLFTMR